LNTKLQGRTNSKINAFQTHELFGGDIFTIISETKEKRIPR
jgi:hypothetical protein